ncbi:tRNA 2-thiouridine(34) synthase MnmA [Candidatus Viridilinea mediisalina]|uniref:tRNA-specific 2-thiouridylase MnmA n=1 Tax=Candidatus Viridilinea mediisalina TaxID=2024553 RepID=A0A2A6RE15_9CHLR|nr:tRNA 2-thiouridine(34) synthase MnmA [Candidatus Viridilinea mediisalina]PDW00407.1 tRNA 2-thiouridine(34) synthase MnmA [Candidatus Viridilinea mediisalina]
MNQTMVAMSGGVDSSLTAALLVEQGHQVVGVTLHLWEGDDNDPLHESLCCSTDMAESARRVCAQLGIPYYVFNYQQEFRRAVVEHFVRTYAQGLTPNPCLECNREIKFRALLARAQTLGFSHVATGHYARIVPPATPEAPYQLWRAVDHAKDQSYVLHMLGQRDLARLLFPLGSMSKAEVRAQAAARGLESANRPESQDICFVPAGDYRNLLRQEAPDSLRPGPIVDLAGRELGQHQGLPLYTIGQRRGLGLGGGDLRYVVALDVARNALVVGPREAIVRDRFFVEQASFCDDQWPAAPFDCLVQVRAHAEAAPATVTPVDAGRLVVQLHQALNAITPGQAAVFYAAERVLGGGMIMRFGDVEDA